MARLESHPVAALFPLLEGQAFEQFKRDIAAHGLRESIWLHEGKIIDGRNRYRACLETGTVPTGGGRPGIAGRIRNQPEPAPPSPGRVAAGYGGRSDRESKAWRQSTQKRSSFELPISQPEAGKLLNVGTASGKRGRVVLERGAPELIAAVDTGKIAVSAAVYPATLAGYRRSFNKKSVENWGTSEAPAPTLGLEPDQNANCIGTAFEFPDVQRTAIENLLRDREGGSFDLVELPVRLPDGREVLALTPVNDRSKRMYIGDIPIAQRATMAKTAKGTSGARLDYVRNIHNKLQSLAIVDTDVEEFLALLESQTRGATKRT